MIDVIDCQICKWTNSFENPTKCKAYPKGIPEVILSGREGHDEHREGDNGIKFEVASHFTTNPKPWSPEDGG